MEIWDSSYFFHSRFCLKPFGLWPYQSYRTKVALRIVTVLSVLTVLIPYLVKAYEVLHEVHHLLLCMPSLLFYAHCVTKFVHLVYHAEEARDLLNTIGHDFSRFKGESLRVLHVYSEMGRRINRFYVAFLCSSVISFNLSAYVPHTLDFVFPLDNGSRPREPVRLVSYHVARFDDSFNFVLYHGFTLDFVVIFIILGFDSLIFICAQHSCALFQVVVVELHRAIDDKQTESDASLRRNRVYRGIANSILIHKHALQFAERLDNLCALVNVLVVAISLATATFTEFATIVHKQNFDVMMKFLAFTIGQFLNILYYNYPGQLVKDHSQLIHESCCKVEWHREDVSNKARMLLILIMLRSQTPSCLTAGKLFVLDLQNFLKILKASVSYFAFLTSVHKF